MPRENASKIEIIQPRKKILTVKVPKHIRAKNFLAELDDVLETIGVEECNILIQKGKKHFKGRTGDGKAINVILRDFGSGFQEQTLSVCPVLSVEDRKIEAMRQKRVGMSQAAIGERLGVSQKTISNDLK